MDHAQLDCCSIQNYLPRLLKIHSIFFLILLKKSDDSIKELEDEDGKAIPMVIVATNQDVTDL